MGVTAMTPPANGKLREARELVAQCDRCGQCLTVCPLFGAKDVETSAARGKNVITKAMADGGLEPTREIRDALDFCLLCQRCVEHCPNKVKTDAAMIKVRQHLADLSGGATLKYRFIGAVMAQPLLVKMGAFALAVVRRLGLGKLFPFGVVPDEYTRTHFLTAFAGPAALGPAAVLSEVRLTKESKVAYFKGCGMQIMFPEASVETLNILKRTTNPIVKQNVCCGLPHVAHGLEKDFLNLAKINMALFEDVDVIVSDCASCSGTLKHMASYFAEDPVWKDRAAAFSAKAMDLTEYLTKAGYEPRQRTDCVITYHDPCHLVRGQGIKKEPRDLLKKTGQFKEMPESDVCCGGSGTFFVDHPGISNDILARKRKNIESTGAQIVVSGCPGCMIQLNKAAEASGGKFKAMHISQVI